MSCVFIISAPSGSGKSTLVNNLLRREPNLLFSVSYTTRDPRGQERDGAQYRFVSREQFEAMIARDEFLEFAQVFGNYYGTHREVVERGQAEGLMARNLAQVGSRRVSLKRSGSVVAAKF